MNEVSVGRSQTIKRLTRATLIIFVISGSFTLLSFGGLFFLSQKKYDKIKELEAKLSLKSSKPFNIKPTYITYPKSDTNQKNKPEQIQVVLKPIIKYVKVPLIVTVLDTQYLNSLRKAYNDSIKSLQIIRNNLIVELHSCYDKYDSVDNNLCLEQNTKKSFDSLKLISDSLAWILDSTSRPKSYWRRYNRKLKKNPNTKESKIRRFFYANP